MKVDTSRLKKGTSEVPPECQNLIDKLKACSRSELIDELSKIETWTFGKCELFHWIDILDIFDEILEEATHYKDNQIYISCDTPQFEEVSQLAPSAKKREKCEKITNFFISILHCVLGSQASPSRAELHHAAHRAQFLATSLQFGGAFDTIAALHRSRDHPRRPKSPLHVLKAQQFHLTTKQSQEDDAAESLEAHC